jgi:hypothetical protein
MGSRTSPNKELEAHKQRSKTYHSEIKKLARREDAPIRMVLFLDECRPRQKNKARANI